MLLIINREFAKRCFRFGFQGRSKTETKRNFGFKRVCEEQSVNFSVSDRNKLSFQNQTHEKPQIQKPTVPLQLTTEESWRRAELHVLSRRPVRFGCLV